MKLEPTLVHAAIIANLKLQHPRGRASVKERKQKKNAKKGKVADKATRNNYTRKWSKKRKNDKEDTNSKYGMDEDDFMILVIFHNLRGYDGQIIIKHITKDFAIEGIVVFPTSTEKFISFQIGNLRFLDALQFLSASLDTLLQTFIKDGTQKFPNTNRHYPNSDLAFHKGTYQYEFMNGLEKFKLRELPLVKSSTAVLRRRLLAKRIMPELNRCGRNVMSRT